MTHQTAVHGAIGPDGLCSLFTFTPFTNNGTASVSISGEDKGNPGHTMMAAALMAMEHFNARNTSVVEELPDLVQGCNVQFDMDASKAFDTGTVGHMASHLLVEEGRIPCAIAGPFNDLPALDLSSMAQAARFPLVAHRAYDARVNSDIFHPYTSLVYPGMIESSTVMVDYLIHKGRTDFVSLLYTVAEVNVQRRETLALALDAAGMTWASYSFFFDNGVPQPQNEDYDQGWSPLEALKQVKDRGYRTIVVFLEDSFREFPVLADAAEELGMNNGDYFWSWFGVFEPALIYSDNANITKLITRIPLLLPLADTPSYVRFTAAWQRSKRTTR